MRNIKVVYTYIFALFCFIIPFNDVFTVGPNILLLVLGIIFPFSVTKSDLNNLKDYPFYALLGFILFVNLITIIQGYWDDFSILLKLNTTLCVVIAWVPVLSNKLLLRGFVLGSTALSAISLYNIIPYLISVNSYDFTVGEHINQLLLGERPYVGFIYSLSAVICYNIGSKENKKLWYLLCAYFIVFVFLMSARMSILSLSGLIFLSIIFRSKIKRFAILGISAIILLLFTFNLNKNLQSRFYLDSELPYLGIVEKLAFEPRYHIWECSIEQSHTFNSLILGKGFKNMESELVNCYQLRNKFHSDDQKQWFIKSKFNTHNQYLDLYYSSGIIAFVLFCTLIVLSIIQNKSNYFALAILYLLLMFLISENVLHRQWGSLLFALVFIFVNLSNEMQKRI